MNALRTLPTRPSSRSLRGAAALFGAVLLAAPMASASAAETDHEASGYGESSLDLRLAVANEQRRLTLELVALLGMGMDRSARGLVDAHGSWENAVSFGFLTEGWSAMSDESVETDETDESDGDLRTEWSRTDDRLEYVTDTDDPLAGL